jgi:hypothetical protein
VRLAVILANIPLTERPVGFRSVREISSILAFLNQKGGVGNAPIAR